MTQHLRQELDALKEKLLEMASMAESAVTRAIEALTKRDDRLALAVEADDEEIDHVEIVIDDMAVHMLSKAPLARDLRLITVSMRISTDLERVGDEATTIARRARKLNAESPLQSSVDIPKMAKMAMEMLDQALKAFVDSDSGSARRVIPRDKEVDALNRQLHRELTSTMEGDPEAISRCLHLMVVSKSLERIADHAKNIAEEAVYLWEAQDIRHPAAQGGDGGRGDDEGGESAGGGR